MRTVGKPLGLIPEDGEAKQERTTEQRIIELEAQNRALSERLERIEFITMNADNDLLAIKQQTERDIIARTGNVPWERVRSKPKRMSTEDDVNPRTYSQMYSDLRNAQSDAGRQKRWSVSKHAWE